MRKIALMAVLILGNMSAAAVRVTVTGPDGNAVDVTDKIIKRDAVDDMVDKVVREYREAVGKLRGQLKQPDLPDSTKAKIIYALGALRARDAAWVLVKNINLSASDEAVPFRLGRWVGDYPARVALRWIGDEGSRAILKFIGTSEFDEGKADGCAEVLAEIEGARYAIMKLEDWMGKVKDAFIQQRYEMVIERVRKLQEIAPGEQTKVRSIQDDEIQRLLPEMLVRAVVVSVGEPNAEEEKGTLTIDHVFKGPDGLIGERFSVLSRKTSYGGIGGLMYPLNQGEIGIWALRRLNSELTVDWREKPATAGIVIPCRKGVSKRYGNVEAAAEAIEAILKEKPAKRAMLIKRYAGSQIPEVSVCAVNMVGRLTDEIGMKYLHGLLADGKLSVLAQIAVDENLSRGEETDAWQISKQRRDVLKEWVSTVTDEYDAAAVKSRIDLIAQHPGKLDYGFILDVVKMAMSNEEIPLHQRAGYLFPLRWIYERSNLGNECFDFLVELISKSKYEEIRTQAAYAIRNFVELDENRTAGLEKVISSLQDQEITKILREAIAKKRGS